MKNILFASLMFLSMALFAQDPLPGQYHKVLQTDSLGYQVVSLTEPALNLRLRDVPFTLGEGSHCVLLNANNEEVFPVPFPANDETITVVTQMVVANGGYPVTVGRVRAIFKQVEVENNDYELNQVVPENDWDY